MLHVHHAEARRVTGTTATFTLPSTMQDGDIIMYAHHSGGSTNGYRMSPTGAWAWDVRSIAGGFPVFGLADMWYRRWRTGDGLALVVAAATSSTKRLALVVLREAGGGDPVANHSAWFPPAAVAAPSVTLSEPGAALVLWSSVADPSITLPAGVEPVTATPGLVVGFQPAWGGGTVGGVPAAVTPNSGGAAFILGVPGAPPILPDRLRSSVSEDAGSLFQATQATAVEMGVSEAFPYGSALPSGVLRPFSEALTPELTAQRYYPLPTRNLEMLVTVDGETNLGRMARTIPGSVMRPAASIPGNVNGLVTAQQAIQYIVNLWAAEHTWLVFEPIPDLRIMLPEAIADPRQYYLDNPAAGILTIAAITIQQAEQQRRSMRESLDEWLEIFTGTIVRQTSRGTIELVPRVGPDAPDGVAATLTWDDLLALSDGEDDPSGVTNRARVTSQGWEWEDNTPLIPPSFLVVRASLGLAESVLDSENVLPDGSRQRAHALDLIRFTSVLSDDEPITVDVEIYAYGSHSQSSALNFSLEGQVTRQVTLARGQGQNVSITHNSRSQNVTATFRVERAATGGPDGITITTPNGIPQQANNLFGVTFFAYVLDIDVEGTGWVRTNESITGEFGQVGDQVPGPGGANVLSESRALHGERLATIQSNAFQLDNVQAEQIARSYVLWNINPRTIRDVQQSEWNKYPVKFDHIGRYVDLPNGERAVVENRDYSDSFQPLAGQMQSTFTASVTEVLIDTETEYLYLDNGDFMQLDNGDLVEVS